MYRRSKTRVSFVSFVGSALTLSCALSITFLTPASGVASDTTSELQWSVHRLVDWLGEGSKAVGWRRYLLLNLLETQSAKGEQADVRLLTEVLTRFSSQAEGLDHPAFVDVKNALQRQIWRLSNQPASDVAQAVTASMGTYRIISAERLDYERDLAIHSLQTLKTHYRRKLPSRERATVFYDLQLDELINFLADVQFEFAPEVSVGKLGSMINDKRDALKEVTREIDAMPFAPQPDDEDDDVSLSGPVPDEASDDGIAPTRPGPEEEAPLDVLKRRREILKTEIQELQKRRKDVLAEDRPRLLRRRDTLLEMKLYSDRFAEVGQDYFDPFFASAALSYERFIRLYLQGTADNLQEDYLERLQALMDDVPALGIADERRAAGRVGNLLEWLDNAGQAPGMVTAVRARYSLPNLYMNVSSRLINTVAGQSINETRVLDENVMGRLVRGYATTSGNVLLDLQEDPNQVHVSVHLQGNVSSSTRFREGKLYGFVGANGQFEARRSLFANIGGLFSTDTDVAAWMDTQFLGITSNLKLVQRIAQKQFCKSKPRSDARAAAQIEQETFEQFDNLTADAVADGQDAVFAAGQRAAAYASLLPEIYIHSHPWAIEVVGKKATSATLAAPNLPGAGSDYADVHLRLHDSMLSNFVDPFFAGKTYTDKELAAEAERIFGEPPASLSGDESEDNDEDPDQSFSITFDSVRPIQFEFDDNKFVVSISGRKFSQGDRAINAGLQIQLRFKIVNVDGKLKFVRDGDAVLEYTNPERKDAKIVAFKSFLEDKLNAVNEEPLEKAIDLPDNLLPVDQVPALKDNDVAKAMRLVECRGEGGWLYLGWAHAPGGGYGIPVNLPAIWHLSTIEQFDADGIQQDPPAPQEDEDQQVDGPSTVLEMASVR